MRNYKKILTTLSCLVTLALSTSAQIVINNSSVIDGSEFTVADDDLLQTAVVSINASGLANALGAGDTSFLSNQSPNGIDAMIDGISGKISALMAERQRLSKMMSLQSSCLISAQALRVTIFLRLISTRTGAL